ncbi:MAG: polysaccharide deacetylase family protein [Thermoleophilaceae bacterium]
MRAHGPARGRRIALTLDDGPGGYTAAILRTLKRLRARATFFVIGSQVAERAALLRRELRQGSEIGNHTWSHTVQSPRRQLRATSAVIRRATGFEPCLSRPPYGDARPSFVAAARRLGMSTVEWDVDPRDWTAPGATAIVKRVMAGAHPGAIVVMHDGGGPRGGTLTALPRIIRGLRRRGYRLVTVSELLGGRPQLDPPLLHHRPRVRASGHAGRGRGHGGR